MDQLRRRLAQLDPLHPLYLQSRQDLWVRLLRARLVPLYQYYLSDQFDRLDQSFPSDHPMDRLARLHRSLSPSQQDP